MADFKTPNLCGANPNLNEALSKIDDLKNEIGSKIDALASDAASAFETALSDVKSGLDGLAIDLPEIPDVNFQSELTSLINDIDRTTIQGLATFNAKLAQLELDFGETLTEKGLSLDSLITDATTKLSAGGNVCDLAPNIEIPSGSSGTGITTEEKEERGSGTSITISETPKEIVSVLGKRTGNTFFSNITYKQSGRTFTTTQRDADNNLISYAEIKVTYTISLIKEKPIEAKQADSNEEEEEVSIVTTNIDSVSKKSEFKINNLIKKLDSLTALNLPTDKINADITKATNEIKSDSFKAKMEADLAFAAAERKKLFADPLNYKPVVVAGAVGEPAKKVEVATPEVQNKVTTEVVTKTNPVTKQEETVEVKKTEKSTISIKGIAMRKVVLDEWFYTKECPPTLAKKKGATLVDDITKLTLKKFPIKVLSVRGRPYYGESRDSRGFKFYSYDDPSEYGSDSTGVKTFELPNTSIELSLNVGQGDDEKRNPANMTIMRVKYLVYEKLDPNFKG